jgi:hypothetical protein
MDLDSSGRRFTVFAACVRTFILSNNLNPTTVKKIIFSKVKFYNYLSKTLFLYLFLEQPVQLHPPPPPDIRL